MKYILFIGEEANFCGRAMLIPRESFIKARPREYELLKEQAKNVTFETTEGPVVVPNLLLQNIVWEGNCGKNEQHPWSAFVSVLYQHAECGTEMGCDPIDQEWVNQCIVIRGAGFDHIKTFSRVVGITSLEGNPIEVTESFVVLETNDGQLKGKPPCDTPEELHKMLYSK